jgi:hypothetical protein
MVYLYNHYAFGQYSSSSLCFKTRRFGDWTLSLMSCYHKEFLTFFSIDGVDFITH